jgi:transposase
MERNMTTTTLNRMDATSAGLPADLREGLGEQILLKLALDSIQSIEPAQLSGLVSSDPRIRPQMMLTLLAYCYASRLYGSREIEWATRNDKTVRYICARVFPDFHAIRHFRRNNRALLEQCLTSVLRKAWVLECDEIEEALAGRAWLGADLDQRFTAAAREKVEVAVIMDTAETD